MAGDGSQKWVDLVSECTAEERVILDTFEREGLIPALHAAVGLLNSEDGLGRHGAQGWRRHPLGAILSKSIRHASRAGDLDEGSGVDHAIHSLVRMCQSVVILGERRR
jgi:hypothetical protein